MSMGKYKVHTYVIQKFMHKNFIRIGRQVSNHICTIYPRFLAIFISLLTETAYRWKNEGMVIVCQ